MRLFQMNILKKMECCVRGSLIYRLFFPIQCLIYSCKVLSIEHQNRKRTAPGKRKTPEQCEAILTQKISYFSKEPPAFI